MKVTNSSAINVIQNIPYITIATVDENGNPWNSPVFAAFDDDLNFYWGSHKESQHSKNIAASAKVFIVIFDSSAISSEGQGVYIQATASASEDLEEVEKAYNMLKIRDSNLSDYWQLDDLRDGGPINIYKAVPHKIWMNDGDKAEGVYIDRRKEIR